jgi:uncharacterized glyoxalase superfamily protein PhnB
VKITASAISLNVSNPESSAEFLAQHFGFRIALQAPGFASLERDDAGMNVVYLARGLETLPADQRDLAAQGIIVAFQVDDLEGELARLESEGVRITMPLTVDDWGERSFQVRDPNGVIVQLLDWNGATA